MSHEFAKIISLPGGTLQAVVMKLFLRGKGPSVHTIVALPSGTCIIHDQDLAEFPTEKAWPVIIASWNEANPIGVATAVLPLLHEALATLNPDDDTAADFEAVSELGAALAALK